MTDLTSENINFSNTDKFGGALQVPGATWTSGSLVSQTSGVPVKMDTGIVNNNYNHSTYMKGATALGDILKEKGYNQEFIIGSDKSFGNRDVYFEGHGDYYILDWKEAKKIGKIPSDYGVWWGYEDSKLFEYAKEEALKLSQEEEPFNLTLLTVNTHFEGGYLEEDCPNIYREQYSSVIACSADQVNDFVRWVQAQDFYDDTTIIISGDHLTMSTAYYENAPEGYTRTIYNLFINSAVKPIETKNRQFSVLDMFPSTLAAMGVKIDGNRLALGTNLFSDEQTLIEKYGYDQVSKGIEARSTYYNNKFIYGTLK
jgi:phosphoglycerol transferase